jgi:hypothetical protein
MEDIKVFELVTGRFVIGKEGEESIEDAIEVMIQENERGIGCGFSPYMFPFNRSMTGMFIDLCNVMCAVPADEQLIAQYIQATTGIIVTNQMPPKGTGLKLVSP